MSVPINKNKMGEKASNASLALDCNLLVRRAGGPIWSPNVAENALEKTRASGAAFAPHFPLLQLFQPLDGVVEFTIRAATRSIKPLGAVRFECPKVTGINPLLGIIKLKDGMVLSSRWEKLNENNCDEMIIRSRDLSHTYEFTICPQVLQGSADDDLASYILGYLNKLGVDVLPEHNRW